MRKKILFVKSTLGQGGADRVTSVLMKHLDRQRYEVSLVLMKKEGEHLTSVPADVTIFSSGASSLWFFFPYLQRTIREYKPDVVFSTDGGTNIPLGMAACFNPFRKWKVILSERNILFPPGKNKLKRFLMIVAKAIFYRFADGLTAVSAGVRKDMKKWLGISPGKIQVVNNPIWDEDMLRQAQENVQHPWFSADREIPVLVHAGRFVHQKDHESLLRAFAITRKAMPVHLFLLGEGPLMPSIKELAGELGISQDVFFAGFDINPFNYMARCDVFVLSSLHEGMPGVLIQAMACEAPAVSTACPFGPDEIISEPGKNGMLVPVKDTVKLSGAILTLLSDKQLRKEMGRKGRDAVARFRVDHAIMSYVDAIEHEKN